MKMILDFLREEEGLTMIEYAVAGGVIALGAATAFGNLGTAVEDKLGEMSDTVTG